MRHKLILITLVCYASLILASVNCQDSKPQVVHEKDEIKKNMREFVNKWQINRKTIFEKEKQKQSKSLPKCVKSNGEIGTQEKITNNQTTNTENNNKNEQESGTQQQEEKQPQEIESSEKISHNVTKKNTTQIVPEASSNATNIAPLQKKQVKLGKKISNDTITQDKNNKVAREVEPLSYNSKIKSKKEKELDQIKKDLDDISNRSLTITEKHFENVKKKIDQEAEETMKATQKQVQEIQHEVDSVAHSSTQQIGKIKKKILSIDESEMNKKLKITLSEHKSLEFDRTPFEKYGQFLTKNQARDATHEIMDAWDLALTEEQESIFDKEKFEMIWEQMSNDDGKIEASQSQEFIEKLLKYGL